MPTVFSFISTKPSKLTLGQHFYDLYYNYMEENEIKFDKSEIESLYFEKDNADALIKLLGIMKKAKWEELPDVA